MDSHDSHAKRRRTRYGGATVVRVPASNDRLLPPFDSFLHRRLETQSDAALCDALMGRMLRTWSAEAAARVIA